MSKTLDTARRAAHAAWPSPEAKLLRAIFGPAPTEQERAEWAERQRAADKAEALRICAEAAEKCSFGKTEAAEWLPATLYGNPVAVAILDGGEVVQAMIDLEGYTVLDELAINNTEVFNAA